MTDLHEEVKAYCNDFSLLYPELISLSGEEALAKGEAEELKKRLFEMGVNP